MKVLITAVLALLRSFGGSAFASTPESPVGPALASTSSSLLASPSELAPVDSNLVYSPLSLELALRLVQPGARGETATELARALGPMPKSPLQQRASSEEITLEVANSVWIRDGFPILPAYRNDVERLLKAQISSLDVTDPSAAAGKINDWAAKQTHGKIPAIAAPSLFGPDFALAVINAVYLKAKWRYDFAKSATRPEKFHPPKGPSYDVWMMRQQNSFEHAETPAGEIVRLSYMDGVHSLWLWLPKKGSGDLSPATVRFDDWKSRMKYTRLNLLLPRFKFESTLQLNEFIVRRGARRIFERDADLTGVSSQRPLYLGFVLQKAMIDVDEVGTEAAAVTMAALLGSGEAPKPPRPLKFDRPFQFFLRNDETGTLLFQGRVARPTPAKSS